MAAMTERKQHGALRVELDALDRRILNVLQESNQLNSQELAERVHSSAPTCLRRLRRLRKSGVISREAALVDPFKVGRDLIAFVHVVMERQTELLQKQFEKRMARRWSASAI
jgi:Lrp/AsnC family leucine-responsive transcriptional regulator